MNQKPIIIVCGAPYSFTSMICKILLSNGAISGDVQDRIYTDIPYDRFEDQEFLKYIRNKQNFKVANKDRLIKHIGLFPDDRTVILKAPMAALFLNDLSDISNRPIRVVYVLRNPVFNIMSTMEKSGRSFIWSFNRYCAIYQACVDCNIDLLTLLSERVQKGNLYEIKRLLEYCELSTDNPDLSDIDVSKIKTREFNYFKYRFRNVLWKAIVKVLRIY